MTCHSRGGLFWTHPKCVICGGLLLVSVCVWCVVWEHFLLLLLWGLEIELDFYFQHLIVAHFYQQKSCSQWRFVYFVCSWCLNGFLLCLCWNKLRGIDFLSPFIHVFQWERQPTDGWGYFPDVVHLAFVNSNSKLVKYQGGIISVILFKRVPTRGHRLFSKAAVFSTFVEFGQRNRMIIH